jgi:Enoyl-CoA hydratase/isomerase
VLADEAKYAVVQARRGVLGDCMSHWTLPHLAGAAVAAELLLTGRSLTGAEAVTMGIATRTMPAAEVLLYARNLARDIAIHVAPMSAALSKRLLWDTVANGYSPRRVAELETEAHLRVMGGADAREGVAAFLERRAPHWTASVSRDWHDVGGQPDARPWSSHVRSAVTGAAPDCLANSRPLSTSSSVGTARTSKRCDKPGAVSTSTLTSLSAPARSMASCSSAGLTIRHGPHQVAQRSTSTGTGEFSTTSG